MDVSKNVPIGLMFHVICNPPIKNISYLILSYSRLLCPLAAALCNLSPILIDISSYLSNTSISVFPKYDPSIDDLDRHHQVWKMKNMCFHQSSEQCSLHPL